jgi:hypothetical protein
MSDSNTFGQWLDDLIADADKVPRDPEMHNHYDVSRFCGWRARAEHLLEEMVGPQSVYYKRFVVAADKAEKDNGYVDGVRSSFQIVESVRYDFLCGRLPSLKAFVTAEVFSDFLDMAEHLLSNQYKTPSASLVGAVLERGLRDLATANALPVRSRDDLSSLASRLAEKNIFTRLTQRTLMVWIDIRNNADHGYFDKYSDGDVKDMLTGVRSFLSQYQSQAHLISNPPA